MFYYLGQSKCTQCDGSGKLGWSDYSCHACGGSGKVIIKGQ